MSKYGIYVIIALLGIIIGTATVAAAPRIQRLVLSSEDGARVADVTPDGRLLVDESHSQLFTLVDGEEIPPGGEPTQIEFPYVNVEGFTGYKVFLRLNSATPPEPNQPSVRVTLMESVDGIKRDASVWNGTVENETNNTTKSTQLDADNVDKNARPPYRFLSARIHNDSTDTPQTVSVFIYAVR